MKYFPPIRCSCGHLDSVHFGNCNVCKCFSFSKKKDSDDENDDDENDDESDYKAIVKARSGFRTGSLIARHFFGKRI